MADYSAANRQWLLTNDARRLAVAEQRAESAEALARILSSAVEAACRETAEAQAQLAAVEAALASRDEWIAFLRDRLRPTTEEAPGWAQGATQGQGRGEDSQDTTIDAPWGAQEGA